MSSPEHDFLTLCRFSLQPLQQQNDAPDTLQMKNQLENGASEPDENVSILLGNR